jgi:hypothetical protein
MWQQKKDWRDHFARERFCSINDNKENNMTPQQKIKAVILKRAAQWAEVELLPLTAENIDDEYDAASEGDLEDYLQDARNEVRSGEVETGLPCEWSRHYESKSVAAQTPDGAWVGWTYWYGGGKHGEPEAIDWIEYAYDLTCVEEEKLVTVRTFTKAD